MDARRFDTLARSLTEAGTRRGLLGLLATLPILGGLFALFNPAATDAKGRRKRRKKRGKHQQDQRSGTRRRSQRKRHQAKKRKRKQKTACAPEGQTPRPGAACCAGLAQDAAGQCVAPPPAPPCAESCAGCCAGETCLSTPTNQRCGRNGQPCAACADGESCVAGVCQAGCKATTCTALGKNCGTIGDGCKGMLECGACPLPGQPCDDNVCGTCVPDCAGKACGADDDCGNPCLEGSCPAPETCGGGDPGEPGVCGCTPSICPANADCGAVPNICGGVISCGPDDCAHSGSVCQETVCQGNICTTQNLPTGTPCDDGDPCTAGSTCTAGVCGGGGTVCTNPPACRTAAGATCSEGVCTYPLAAAGAACDSVPCGVCDSSGACLGSCTSPETCVGGTCRSVAGTCAAGQETCVSGWIACNSSDNCTCDTTFDGVPACRGPMTCRACANNADCGANHVCLRCASCGGTSCAPVCPG